MTLSSLYLGNCRVGGYQGHEELVASAAVVWELHWGGGGGGGGGAGTMGKINVPKRTGKPQHPSSKYSK